MTNRLKQRMKKIKTFLSLVQMQLNYETLCMLSKSSLSLTVVVIWTRVRKDSWLLCGDGF